MKSHYQIFHLVFLLAYLCCNFVLAQTNSRLAQQWFDTGRTEKDLNKKIEAFHKAVEADPKFVQALYYLGLTYKTRKDFVRAELFLSQAKDAGSSLRKPEDKFAIYYELSKVHLRIGNAVRAEQLL
ncbi:MAG: tetratricopeptide repeat protein, partial [bacterium]